jgi:hypothetical protein
MALDSAASNAPLSAIPPTGSPKPPEESGRNTGDSHTTNGTKIEDGCGRTGNDGCGGTGILLNHSTIIIIIRTPDIYINHKL